MAKQKPGDGPGIIRIAFSQTYKFRVHIIALIIAMSFSGYIAVTLGQDASFDYYNYHYNNAYAYVENTSSRQLAVSGMQSYENPIRDVPAYYLMSNLSAKKAGFLLGAMQGINIWLLFEIALLVFRHYKHKNKSAIVISGIVSLLALFGAGNQSIIGTTLGDNTTSIFVLLAILLLLYSVQNNRKPKMLSPRVLRVISYVSIGLSVGLKLTNVVYAVAFFIAGSSMLTAHKSSIKLKVKQLFIDLAAFIGGVLVISGSWMYQSYVNFGNPIFPFYNGIFKSEYYPAVNFIDSRWTNSSITNSLLEPFSYFTNQNISSEVAFADPRLALLLVSILLLGVLSLIHYRKKSIVDKLKSAATSPVFILVVFTVVAYIVWAIQFSYYRYIIVLEMLSVVIIGAFISKLVGHRSRLTIILLALISLYLLSVTQQTSWGRIPWQDTNFGVKKQTFEKLDNSTVLIAGYAPFSFMVPYFPESTQSVRIVSDLSHPKNGGTPKMKDLIKDKVNQSKQEQDKFYGLYVDEELKLAKKSFKEYGFKIGECSEVPVTVRMGLASKYRLCKLINTDESN